MSLKTWAGFRVSADNAHGVIRPRPQRMQASPGSACPILADWPTRCSSSRRLLCTSPNIACRRSRRKASHRVRSSSRRMPARISMPRSLSARRRACSSSLARPAGRWRQRWKRSPLMVCRVAALPGHRPRRAGVRAGRRGPACPERSAATRTISSRLPPKRPTISPRASTSSPASAAVAGAPSRRSCRDDRAGKAPGAHCRSASPHGRSCPPPGGFAVGQRGGPWRIGSRSAVGADSRVASRPSISGICMSISTASNGTLASSTC